jgi:hypothetical protein
MTPMRNPERLLHTPPDLRSSAFPFLLPPLCLCVSMVDLSSFAA